MGVRRAFDERQADLSGIGGRRGDLVISEVVQKSFVNVSEGGVEAAAATSVCKYFYDHKKYLKCIQIS